MNKKIAIIADNSLEYIHKLLEIWNEKNCAVLIDWRLPWDTIERMLDEANVSYCFIDDKVDITETKHSYEIIKSFKTVQELDSECYEYTKNYSSDDALILFSSGTTGNKKGIVLSFFAIETNSDMVTKYMNLTGQDRMYIMKALSHSSTTICELLVALKSNIKLYITPTIRPISNTISNLVKYKITITCMNPTLLTLFCNYIEKKKIKLNNLRVIYISGSILREDLKNRVSNIIENVKICNVYGLTECGPRVSAQTEDGKMSRNSVGKVLNGIEVEIRNQKGDLLQEKQKGILWVKTPTLFTKYLNEKCYVDLKGFFCTNDIGFLENDELFIVGRADNMIISSSHNIFPEEIESVINLIDGIQETVVLGINDEIYGQKLICIYEAEQQMNDNIRKYCKKRLASYEIPQVFIQCSNLPRNTNGKILRRELVEYLENLKTD